MADETTQTGEETSWWAFDAFADSELPSTPFDEPLEWPETLEWGDFSAGDDTALRFPQIDDLASEPILPPASALEPEPPSRPDPPRQAAGDNGDLTMPHVTVLAGLGGGTPSPPAADADLGAHERLPDSLWAPAPQAGTRGTPLVTTTIAAPTFRAPPDGGPGGRSRRFELRHGNAAVIALISFVSLVLLGMFMSVRARNNLPDSQTRTADDQISVQVPLNTVPLTTTVTTAPPTAPINIADLIPPPPPEEATTTAGSGSSGSSAGTSATTAAPARTTPAGGSTGTTQPAAQSTNTTAAPQTTTPPEVTTPATSPPADQTTTPTTPRRTPPTFPSLSTTVTDNTAPTFTIPSIPGFPGFGGFGG